MILFELIAISISSIKPYISYSMSKNLPLSFASRKFLKTFVEITSCLTVKVLSINRTADVITPDLLTKEIIEAFIKKIIVVDKTTVVMVVASTGETEPKTIKERRKEIANQEPILIKEVLLERHFRPETLTYKVVRI